MKELKFLDENQRQLLGKTLLDFSKIVLAAALASEFFREVPISVSIISYIIFSISFALGIWFNKKGD